MKKKPFSDPTQSNISRLYISGVRRLHFLLPLATMVPYFCYIATLNMPEAEAAASAQHFVPLYLFTLTLAIPAAFFYLIQEKAANLAVFGLCACPVSILYLGGMFFLEDVLGLSVMGAERVPQSLILLLFLLDAIRMRTNDNSRRKAKAQEDHSWTGDAYLLPLPMLRLLVVFAILYIGALFLHSNEIALVCLLGAILYFFLVLPYHVQVRKDAFLESRHHLSRVPKKQIQRLQTTALLKILLPCALLALTALMTSGGRHFLDLPTLRMTITPDPAVGGMPPQDALLKELMDLGILQEGAPPPEWLLHLIDFVENALTILVTAVILYGIWLFVRSAYLRFRKEYEEEHPAFSRIQMRDEHVSLKKARRQTRPRGALQGIRRRYQRTILHYRGKAPDIYETPSLMEERAGIPDTPQMRRLHEEYEQARYAR